MGDGEMGAAPVGSTVGVTTACARAIGLEIIGLEPEPATPGDWTVIDLAIGEGLMVCGLGGWTTTVTAPHWSDALIVKAPTFS